MNDEIIRLKKEIKELKQKKRMLERKIRAA